MAFWCDPVDGHFKGIFETIDLTASEAAYDTSYEIPYSEYGEFNSVHPLDISILACNPFMAKGSGIEEENNCQTLDNVDGAGTLEIMIKEFTGWVGAEPH